MTVVDGKNRLEHEQVMLKDDQDKLEDEQDRR
jgi:hypothetical protein